MSATERHYSTREIGKLWGISPDLARKIFRDVPGVLKIGEAERLHKRVYLTLRIPESVLQKKHAELRGVPRAA